MHYFYPDPDLDDPGTFKYVVVISEVWLLAFSHSSFLSSPVKLCLRVHFKVYDSGLAYNLSIGPKGYWSRFRTQFPISLHIWKGRLHYRDAHVCKLSEQTPNVTTSVSELSRCPGFNQVVSLLVNPWVIWVCDWRFLPEQPLKEFRLSVSCGWD